MSVIKHVTLNRSDDWSIDAPLYTSQLDIIVARRLDTRGLHLESDDTPKQLKAREKIPHNVSARISAVVVAYAPYSNLKGGTNSKSDAYLKLGAYILVYNSK